MESEKLTRYLARAPREPGVYIWRDAQRRPLYIGKASNLKARLSSYRKAADSRIQLMVQTAVALTWQTTDTDIEALILESQLIKQLHPKYNIDLRDNKQYFFVGFTKDEFPHIFLTHQPLKTENLKLRTDFIGPFTEGVPLKSTLSVLRNLFPYCTCKQKHHLKCLNAHIGKCPGFCCLKAPSSKLQAMSYRKNIRAIRDILTGKRANVIRRIVKDNPEMAFRVIRVFQNARIVSRIPYDISSIRNTLYAIRDTFGLASAPNRIEGYDIANIQGEHRVGAMVVFTDGRADNAQYRLFNIRTAAGGDTAMLTEMLRRRLAHPEWPLPDLILVDGGKAQLNTAVKSMKRKALSIPVVAVQKDEHHRPKYIFSSLSATRSTLSALPRPVRDLLVHVDEEAHRFSISRYRRKHRRGLIE